MYQANTPIDTPTVSLPFMETLARMVVVPQAPKAAKLARFGLLYGSAAWHRERVCRLEGL